MECAVRGVMMATRALRLPVGARGLAKQVVRTRQQTKGKMNPKGGKGAKGGKGSVQEQVVLSKEQQGRAEMHHYVMYGDGKQQKPKRTAEELAEMQAHSKEYSRRMLQLSRARNKRLGELIRLQDAAVAALPEGRLRAEADTPDDELPWYDYEFPYDDLMPTETPPIDDFEAKVAAAEEAIVEERAAAARAAEAERKREERARRMAATGMEDSGGDTTGGEGKAG